MFTNKVALKYQTSIMAPLMYVLLAYGYLGDRFQAWYLKLCIQSSNYVHTIKFTELIIKFLSGKILLPPPKNNIKFI